MDDLEDILGDVDWSTAVFDNGLTLEGTLRQEAERLKKCIEDEIQKYYDSYSPIMYSRTGAFQNSVEIEDMVNMNIDVGQMSIMVGFNDDAYHPSLFGGDKGYVPALINDGWSWKNQPQTSIYRFTYFDGTGFFERAIAEFLSDNPYGVTVDIIK